jgi:hypothetical protein
MSAFQKFHREIYLTSSEFPVKVEQVIYFVSWLHKKGKSHNTISTYVAGLSYFHRLTQRNVLLSKSY